MLIEFDSTIFNSKDNYHKLMFLYNLFYAKRRHDFFVDISEVANSPLYTSLNVNDHEIIVEYFNRQVQANAPFDYVISEIPSEETYVFTLEEATIFFNQPVFIILENSLNDKCFVECLVNNFSKKGKKIRRHLDNLWISYLNGGGCTNIANVISEKLDTYKNLPKPPHIYLRAFVLVDSDSEYPGQVKESRNELKNFLEKLKIEYHFLTKREMENYMPDEVYDTIPNNDQYISSYKRLTPVQKDYLDIQKGFEYINFTDYSVEVQKLFEKVPAKDMSVLRKDRLKITDFKGEFPKLFLSDAITQAGLLKRVEHQINDGELGDILTKINDLL